MYHVCILQAQHNAAFQSTLSSHSARAPVIDSSSSTNASLALPKSSSNAPVVGFSCSAKAQLVLPNISLKAPVSTPVHFSTKAPVAHSRHDSKGEGLTKSKNEMNSKTSHQSSLQTQQTLPLKEVKVEKSPSKGDTDFLASENHGKAPHGKLQSCEEPGPSTHSTSSNNEETGFWAYKKRDKKPKHLSRKVKV